MRFTVLSLFPEIIAGYFADSIANKAVERGLISYDNVNFREYATDKHRTCDDAPYGGGAGMVLKPEPLAAAIEAFRQKETRVVYPSPSGRPFTQAVARRLAGESHLIFIAGRYEGVDQRVIDLYVDEELSLGDYVMASGELASLVVIDSVMRLIDGVITAESLQEESFEDGLLEYPHYTRPASFRGLDVPAILLTGHHARITAWRRAKRVEKTLANRPEIMQNGEDDALDAERGTSRGKE